MNTRQNYEKLASQANSIESTAEKATQNPPSTHKQTLLPDCQQWSLEPAQAHLLDLVDDYFREGYVSEPIELINNLLYCWLTTPTTRLDMTANQAQLHRAFRLVNFLTELHQQNVSLQSANDQSTAVC